MIRHFIFVFVILLANNLYSQAKLSVGVGLAICHDYSETFDPGNQVVIRPGSTLMLSIDVRRRFKDHWFAESGIYIKGNNVGFGFAEFGYSSGGNIPGIGIPVRIIPKLTLIKNRLHISPVIGLLFGYNTNYGLSSYGSGFSRNSLNDNIDFNYESDYGYNKTYTLFQAGISVEFVFKNLSTLQIQSNYYSGQHKLVQTNISYQINNGPIINAISISNGSFWQVLGLTYLFSFGNNSDVTKIE